MRTVAPFENRTRICGRDRCRRSRFVAGGSTTVSAHFRRPIGSRAAGIFQQSVELARQLKELGADLIDCSSGGNVPHAKIPVGRVYQTPVCGADPLGANILTGAVGMITSPFRPSTSSVRDRRTQSSSRGNSWRDPYWPLRAARELGQGLRGLSISQSCAGRLAGSVHGRPQESGSCFEEQHAIPEG